ncbi:spermidine synthase [Salvia divinorum]|uniref:Spermidine synthase n=1 Tax=Salvia divinorum TaxID=28513 RepID=A0ABD1IE91_SALDI
MVDSCLRCIGGLILTYPLFEYVVLQEAAQSVGELPVKKPREEMETNNGAVTELPECMSFVIPEWFSEISPMWPA